MKSYSYSGWKDIETPGNSYLQALGRFDWLEPLRGVAFFSINFLPHVKYSVPDKQMWEP